MFGVVGALLKIKLLLAVWRLFLVCVAVYVCLFVVCLFVCRLLLVLLMMFLVV